MMPREIIMIVADKIHQRVRKLPTPLQAEVLDFVDFLFSRMEVGKPDEADELVWTDLSLAMALQGMEDEPMPEYTVADLRVVFS
jgi:hypothetical protein